MGPPPGERAPGACHQLGGGAHPGAGEGLPGRVVRHLFVSDTTVRGAAGNGILVADHAELRISASTVRDSAFSAVHVTGEATADLTAVRVEGTPEHGIGVFERGRLSLADGWVAGCGLSGPA